MNDLAELAVGGFITGGNADDDPGPGLWDEIEVNHRTIEDFLNKYVKHLKGNGCYSDEFAVKHLAPKLMKFKDDFPSEKNVAKYALIGKIGRDKDEHYLIWHAKLNLDSSAVALNFLPDTDMRKSQSHINAIVKHLKDNYQAYCRYEGLGDIYYMD